MKGPAKKRILSHVPALQTLQTDEKIISLAPAAGAGIGRMVAEALLADPQFIPLMKAAAAGALEATTRRWDKDSDQWIVDPDYRTRLQAWLGILAHMEGDPVKRILHQHVDGKGALNLGDILAESPELREAMAKELQKATWKTSGQQAHKKPKKVVEATAGPAGAF